MADIINLRNRAKKIRGAFLAGSVTNDEVGLLLLDMIDFIYNDSGSGGGSGLPDRNYWNKEEMKFFEEYLTVFEDKIKAGYADNAMLWDDKGFSDYIDQPVRSTDEVTFGGVKADVLRTTDFIPGPFGVGTGVLNRNELHTDKLLVRKELEVLAMVVQRLTFRGGMNCLSLAGMKIVSVEEEEEDWKCFFESNAGDIMNGFVAGDLVRCNRFSGAQKYYWAGVVATGQDFICLSKTDKDGSGIPESGDELVQMGHRTNPKRQWALVESARQSDAGITLYKGIDGFDLSGKAAARFGVDPLNPDQVGVFVSGGRFENIAIGSNCTGLNKFVEYKDVAQDIQNALEVANEADRKVQEAQEYITGTILPDLETLQAQVDGQVNSWFYAYTPTRSNYPASSWDTVSKKDAAIGDTFTNTQEFVDNSTTPDAGKSWRWVKEDTTYKWTPIADSDAVKALAKAAKAEATADGKSTIHLLKPSVYGVGDVWILENEAVRPPYKKGEMLNAVRGNTVFNANDWEKRDLSARNEVDGIQIGGVNLINGSESITISTKIGDNYAYKEIVKIESDKEYSLSIDSIILSYGTATSVSVLVYDFTATYGILGITFNITSTRQENVFKCPEYPEGHNVALLIYAGRHGSTSGNSVTYNKIQLEYGNKSTGWKQSPADQQKNIDYGKLFLLGSSFDYSAPRQFILNNDGINRAISGRGINLITIKRSDLSIIDNLVYDTYGYDTVRQELVDKLHSLDDSVIVTLTSFDSMGAGVIDINLIEAIALCGGSGSNTPFASEHLQYAFVGIPGIGRGNGIEVYTNKNAPRAEISTQIINGIPSGMSSASSIISKEAQVAADEAKARLTAMSSDGIISKEEKATLRNDKSQIDKEFASYQQQATMYGVSIASFQMAYNTLTTFLTGIVLIDQDTDFAFSTGQKDIYNKDFADYYSERTAFANLIAKKVADGAVDGLQIGGTNLLDQSNIEKASLNEYLEYADIVSVIDKNGVGEYTISFDIKTAIPGDGEVYFKPGNPPAFKYLTNPETKIIISTDVYVRHFITTEIRLNPGGANYFPLSFYFEYGTGVIPTVKNVKIERGNKATAWSPSLADQQFQLEAIAQAIADTKPNTFTQVAMPGSARKNDTWYSGTTKEDTMYVYVCLTTYTSGGSMANWLLAADNTGTTIQNGLITTGTIYLRGGASADKLQIRAGMSGRGETDNSVRFWAGGTLAQANALVANPNATTGVAGTAITQDGYIFTKKLIAVGGEIGGFLITNINLKSSNFTYPEHTNGNITTTGSGTMIAKGGLMINGTGTGILPPSSGVLQTGLITAISDSAMNAGLEIVSKCTSAYGYLSEVVALKLSASNAYSGIPNTMPMALVVQKGGVQINSGVPGISMTGNITIDTLGYKMYITGLPYRHDSGEVNDWKNVQVNMRTGRIAWY